MVRAFPAFMVGLLLLGIGFAGLQALTALSEIAHTRTYEVREPSYPSGSWDHGGLQDGYYDVLADGFKDFPLKDPHARDGHAGQMFNTISVHKWLSEGACAAVRRFCRVGDKEMYLCKYDRRIGILFVEAGKLASGHEIDSDWVWKDIAREEGYKPCR